MERHCFFLWIVAVVILFIDAVKSTTCAGKENVSSVCIKDADVLQTHTDGFHVVCDSGHVVANIDITAGFSNLTCHYDPDVCRDVTSVTFTSVISDCLWKKQCCTFPSQRGDETIKFVTCDTKPKLVDFMQMSNAVCVHDSRIVRMCKQNSTVRHLTNGYILSPGYPVPYRQHNNNKPINCSFVIDLPLGGHDVLVTSQDMAVRPSHQCSVDYIYFRSISSGVEKRFCGSEKINITFSGSLLVGFVTGIGHNKHYRGYVLQFRAIPAGELSTKITDATQRTSSVSTNIVSITTTGYVSSSLRQCSRGLLLTDLLCLMLHILINR